MTRLLLGSKADKQIRPYQVRNDIEYIPVIQYIRYV